MNPLQKTALIVGCMVALWALSGLLGMAAAWVMNRVMGPVNPEDDEQ